MDGGFVLVDDGWSRKYSEYRFIIESVVRRGKCECDR